MNCKDFSNFLNGLSGYELVAIASFLSFIIANKLSSDEINILGSFFSTLGQNLSTIASTMSDD